MRRLGSSVLYGIIIGFRMEKREHLEKWSEGSTGSPSEGSQYSVTNHHYYQKYQLIHQNSLVLQQRLTTLADQQKNLLAQIAALATRAGSFVDPIRPQTTPKKKVRRIADQIHKCYRCQVENCQKLYASETSLRCHTKHAHPHTFTARKKGRRVANNVQK